jgi:hypothetical protein
MVNTSIRFNSALTDARVPSYLYTRDLPLESKYVSLANNYRANRATLLQKKRDEFLTAPPITVLSLLGNASDLRPEASTILRVRHGIRVGHLLEAFDEIDACTPREVSGDWVPDYDYGHFRKALACFTTCKTRTWEGERDRFRGRAFEGYPAE